MPRSTAKTGAKSRLLDAALSVIRTKGYTATSVDELCAAAGVTKVVTIADDMKSMKA